jgi:hypothetical protein
MGKDERTREDIKRRVRAVLLTRPIALDLSAVINKSGAELVDELIEQIAELVAEDIGNDYEPGALCARCGKQREEHKPVLLCDDEAERLHKDESQDQ